MEMLKPSASIIIPCRNEALFIDQCLESVFSFEPIVGGYEVLIIDGMSDDGTRYKLAEWAKRWTNLRILDNPERIVPTGMNIGIKAAYGNWVVRLDAHSVYPPDYLRLCIETSQRTGADNVGGLFITLPRSDTPEALLVQALTTHGFGVGNADFRLGSAQEAAADTVPYGCFRRDVFKRIGMFDERLIRNQDYELNRRLIRAGGTIWRNPAIRIHYYNQGSLSGLFRQALFTGQWNPWMWYVAPYSFAPRHAIPGIFVLGLLGAIALSFVTIFGKILLALILVPYLLLAIMSAFQQARQYRWWLVGVLPLLFFLYHLAYGAGIVWGIIVLLFHKSPVQTDADSGNRQAIPE